MIRANDINILICDRDPKYSRSICKILSGIGLKKTFCVSSHVEMEQVSNNHKINIALIDTEFNGMGGFATGQKLIEKNPDIIVLYITNPQKRMDPIKSLLFGGSNFVFRDDLKGLLKKTTVWVNILQNSLYTKALIHE